MISEAQKLRRKVLLARTATLVVLGLVLIGYLFCQWAATESGIVTQAENSLKNESSKAKILEALDIAERFSKSGKTESADKIAKAADQALKLGGLDAATRVKSCLELASDLSKRGDKNMAARYSKKAIVAMKEQSEGPKAAGVQLSLLNESAQMILQSKSSLADDELRALLILIRKLSVSIVDAECSAPLDLALESIAHSNPAPSAEVLNCMFVKEEVLARLAKVRELQPLMKRSGEYLDRLAASSPVSFDLVPLHMLRTAAFLYAEDPGYASGLMDRAAVTIASVDSTSLDDNGKQRLADCYRNLSEICLNNARHSEAVNYARKAVELRSLQDARSCECVRQLVRALCADKNYKEAEPLARSALKFFKAQNKDFPRLTELRGACAYAYFDVLVALKRSSQAVSVLTEELAVQKKLLPSTAESIISIYCKLADFHLERDEYKLAAKSAKHITELLKYLTESEKVDACMLLIAYGEKTHTPDLTLEASMNALASIKKEGSAIKQSYLGGLCRALDSLQKSGASDTYSQALDCVKAGFVQQLSDPAADPAVLADVINQLGTSGEERTADGLRSEAQEKLSPAKVEAFLAGSMDFVLTGEKESAQYETPLNSIKVFLDMAHNMQNKDEEAAFKYAFEVLKISELLLSKNPQLKESLFGDLDDAATLLLSSKKTLNASQLRIIGQLCKDEKELVEKNGRTGVLDLLLVSEARNNLSPGGSSLNLIFLKSRILAKRGQASLLDAHINKYRSEIQEAKDNKVELANFYADLSDSLWQAKEQLAARRYLGMARRALEDSSAQQNKDSELKSAAVLPGEAQSWNRLALSFSKLSDSQSALACARKSMLMRPLKDSASLTTGLILVDGLTDTGNLTEAESQAIELYKVARAQSPTSENFALRAACLKRLLRVYRESRKDAESMALLKDELKDRLANTQARASQTAELYRELGYLYLQAQDGAALYEALSQLRQLREQALSTEPGSWERSNISKDIVYFAVVLRQPKLAAEAILDLDKSKSMDKAQALRSPEKWWQTGLSLFKKGGDDASYNALLELVQAGFKQELQRTNPDPSFLASVLNDLGSAQEDRLAQALLTQAKKKLSEAGYKSMSGELKGLTEAQAAAETPAKEAGSENKGQSKTAEKDSGRLELED